MKQPNHCTILNLQKIFTEENRDSASGSDTDVEIKILISTLRANTNDIKTYNTCNLNNHGLHIIFILNDIIYPKGLFGFNSLYDHIHLPVKSRLGSLGDIEYNFVDL